MAKSVIRARRDLMGDEMPNSARRDLIGEIPKIGKLPDAVTLDDLAILLGVVPRAITEMARQEHVIRISHGQYDLRKSIKAYCNHLRGRASSESLTAERTRQTKEAADHLAFKNAKLNGDLLSAVEVEQEWAGILRDVRAALLAIPTRMQQRVGTLTLADIAAVDHEIRDILNQLGNDHADRNA